MSGPDLAPSAATASGSTDLMDVKDVIEEIKPRLRGWLHTNAAIVSLVSGATLIAVSSALGGIEAGLATAIYSFTVTALFGSSALYHRYPWSPRAHQVMKRLDHSMIFVFIAGTYTPIAVLALHGTTSVVVLAVVWSGALAGVVLQSGWPDSPRWLSVPCYIALGWVAVFVAPQLIEAAGLPALILIVAGGVVYTVGGVVYALKRPDPVPAVFGFHEVFHLCTLIAAACHYIAIWLIVFD